MNTMDTLRVRVLRVCSALSGLAVEFRRSFRTPVFMELNKRPTFALAANNIVNTRQHTRQHHQRRTLRSPAHSGWHAGIRASLHAPDEWHPSAIHSKQRGESGGALVSDKPQQLSNAR